MVVAVKPAGLTEKLPEVTTGFVVESTTPTPNCKGLLVVLYTTPLERIGIPPLEIIVPPTVAMVAKTLVATLR